MIESIYIFYEEADDEEDARAEIARMVASGIIEFSQKGENGEESTEKLLVGFRVHTRANGSRLIVHNDGNFDVIIVYSDTEKRIMEVIELDRDKERREPFVEKCVGYLPRPTNLPHSLTPYLETPIFISREIFVLSPFEEYKREIHKINFYAHENGPELGELWIARKWKSLILAGPNSDNSTQTL